MKDHEIEPVYCPRCRKGLVSIGSVCSNCGFKLSYEGIKELHLYNIKSARKLSTEELKKKIMRSGYLISGFTLPFLIGLTSIWNFNILYFLMYITPWSFLFFPGGFITFIFAILVNIIGLRLIFFSIRPKSKGYFLIIFGYFLFTIFFLIQTSINFDSVRNVLLYLVFIDIPILTMIIFGIYNIYNFENKTIPDIICFIPVLFSNIFPYIFYLFP